MSTTAQYRIIQNSSHTEKTFIQTDNSKNSRTCATQCERVLCISVSGVSIADSQLFDGMGKKRIANNYDLCFLTILPNGLLKKRCIFVLGLMATCFGLDPMAIKRKIWIRIFWWLAKKMRRVAARIGFSSFLNTSFEMQEQNCEC